MKLNFVNRKIAIVLIVVIGFVISDIVSKEFSSKESILNNNNIVTRVHLELEPISKIDLVKRSDMIIIGRIKNIKSSEVVSKIRKGETDIVSDLSVLIERFIRNPINYQQQEIIVRTLGGEIPGKKMIITDMPSFIEEEKLFLFLRKGEGGVLVGDGEKNIFVIVGWGQGKYKINYDGRIGVGVEKNFLNRIFKKSEFTLEELVRGVEE